jgi:hypothetical protein
LTENPKGLAFGSNEKHQFVALTNRNSVLLVRTAQIPDRLRIIVPCISFTGFGYTEEREFVTKTDRNYVFLDRKAHILNWLHIMVMYLSFYKF